MVDLIALTNAFVTTLGQIPELVANLAENSAASVVGYIDKNPTRNSIQSAIYSQKPGTVLVIWQNTILTEGEMSMWAHHVQFYARAARDSSALAIISDLINGVPVPGDGLCWRYCPVMAGVLPTTVIEINREIDQEGIDYYAIMTETKETGDA